MAEEKKRAPETEASARTDLGRAGTAVKEGAIEIPENNPVQCQSLTASPI